MNVGATEITVGQGASLHLATFQRWGGNVHHFGTERVRVGRDARFHWTYTALGGKLTKLDLEMHLDGEGSEAKFSGCYFGNAGQWTGRAGPFPCGQPPAHRGRIFAKHPQQSR